MFAIKIEKQTPSGNAAKNLIKIVAIAPIMPYITLLGDVIGEVTGSDIMKTNANKNPPLKISNAT